MVNIYRCEKCGNRVEIPQGHADNKLINVAGIVEIPSCGCGKGEEKEESL